MTHDSVWFLLPDFPVGGVETVTAALINGMARKEVAVTLVLCDEHIKHPCFELLDPRMQLVVLDRKPGLFGYIRAMLKFRKMVSKHRPQAIISAKEHANIINVFACLAQSTCSIVTRHVPILEKVNKSGGDSNWYTPLIYRLINRFASKLVAVSNGIRDEIIQLIPSRINDIQTIYNPVIDDALLKRAEEPITEPFWDTTRINIVAVGRLCKQKGYDHLFKAFKLTLVECPNARLTVFGDGDDRASLEKLVQELDIQESVCLPGHVSNPIKFIVNAKVFALSSRWEGLPTVMIEAAAVNTLIVAFDCPTGPKEIFDTGIHGYLIEKENTEKFALGLQEAICDTSAFVNPIESFLHQSAVAAYIRLYNKEPCIE